MATGFDLAMANMKGAIDHAKASFQGQSDFYKNQLQNQFNQVKRQSDDHQSQIPSQLPSIPLGLYGGDFSKYNMGSYRPTWEDIKREDEQRQMSTIALKHSTPFGGTDWDAYLSELQRAGLINKNALPKGFKNQYYDDAIKNPDKYTWGVWDASKPLSPDNWQPKPRVAGDARDTAKKASVFTTTVTSQPTKSALVQTTPTTQKPSTIESSSAKFAQTVNSTPTAQQLTPTAQQSENNQPSYFSNTSQLSGVDLLANQNNKPKNYFDTDYFSR